MLEEHKVKDENGCMHSALLMLLFAVFHSLGMLSP